MAYYTNVEDMNCWYVSICVKFENYPCLTKYIYSDYRYVKWSSVVAFTEFAFILTI